MWYTTAAIVTSGTLLASTVAVRRKINLSPIQRLERIRTIDNLVEWLQRIAARKPTECLVDEIHTLFRENGIHESTLQTLSKLHRIYGANNGVRGYAINQVWSVLAHGISNSEVIIID